MFSLTFVAGATMLPLAGPFMCLLSGGLESQIVTCRGRICASSCPCCTSSCPRSGSLNSDVWLHFSWCLSQPAGGIVPPPLSRFAECRFWWPLCRFVYGGVLLTRRQLHPGYALGRISAAHPFDARLATPHALWYWGAFFIAFPLYPIS